MTLFEPITRVRTSEEPEEFTIYSAGAALDITGATFTLTVNPSQDGSEDDSFSISGSITDAANGVVQFTPSTSNAALAAGTYYYDLKMVLSSVPSFPARGTWVILAEIT